MSARRAGRRERNPVQAAGAVLWKGGADDVRVALVHRPKYDDWSFPKGKLDPGESHEDAAVREVAEETGVLGVLGVELSPTSYVDGKGRPKRVRYWAMEAGDHREFIPNDEVDEVRWVDVVAAEALLSYDHDLVVLTSFVNARPAD